jgi:DNA-binding CsgD family transcriptional regulator
MHLSLTLIWRKRRNATRVAVDTLYTQFRDYCHAKIRGVAQDVPEARKRELVESLRSSPFRAVVQAFSVLDFYDYRHLHAEGYEHYFGWKDAEMNAAKILEIVHPEDQEAFGMLYYLCLEGLMNMPIPVKNIGHFCISYRVRMASGEYCRVLETNSILESDETKNIPLICLSQMTRVENTGGDQAVRYYFKLFRDEFDSVRIMGEYLKQYAAEVNIFSDNEIKIVSFIKAGLTSKEIADKVCLSKHTVDKYRKNLLEKTRTKSSPQLADYMTRLGLV